MESATILRSPSTGLSGIMLSVRTQYKGKCNRCGPAAAEEIPSSEQEALYDLRGSRESI